MAEFDKFYGKSLPQASNKEASSRVVIPGAMAESCARKCAKQEGACRAFQVCGNETTGKPKCTLAMRRQVDKKEEAIDFNSLEANKLCTAFVLSKSSDLRTLDNDDKLELQTPDHELNYEPSSKKSSFPHKFFLVVIGFPIGYVLALLGDHFSLKTRLSSIKWR